jgi:hypothetical protein
MNTVTKLRRARIKGTTENQIQIDGSHLGCCANTSGALAASTTETSAHGAATQKTAYLHNRHRHNLKSHKLN